MATRRPVPSVALGAGLVCAFLVLSASDRSAAQGGVIPELRFVEPTRWVKVEVIDNVEGGCFLRADEAREHALRGIGELGHVTEGDEDVFHVVFRISASGGRTAEGRCFGAIFFDELYPIEVVVQPGAEPNPSYWHGRLGLQKLLVTEDAFDGDVAGVIEDAIRVLFRER